MRSPRTSHGSVPPGPMLVGRRAETARVAKLWRRSRLVVVVGPRGVGKTAFARSLVDALATRVRPACACPAGGAEAVVAALSDTVLGAAAAGADAVRAVAARLDRDDATLLVDGVDHADEAGLAALLRIASRLRRAHLLLTSRAELELGEQIERAVVVPLAPLALADATRLVHELLARVGRSDDADALARASDGIPLWCRLLALGRGPVSERLAPLLEGLAPGDASLCVRLAVATDGAPAAWVDERDALSRLSALGLLAVDPRGRVALPSALRDAVRMRATAAELLDAHRAWSERAEEHGALDVAAEHGTAAGDPAGASVLLERGGAATFWAQRRVGDYLRLAARIEAAGASLGPAARLRRCLCLSSEGRVDDAASELARTPRGDPSLDVLRATVELGVAISRGDPRAARDELVPARGDARGWLASGAPPSDVGALAALRAWDLASRGAYGEAIALCDAAASGPADADASARARLWRIAAELSVELGRLDDARRFLDQAAQSGDGEPWLDVVGTRLALQAGLVRTAKEHLALARRRAEADPSALGVNVAIATALVADATRGRLDARARLDALRATRTWLHPFHDAALRATAATLAAPRDLAQVRAEVRALLRMRRGQRPLSDELDALIALARTEAPRRPGRALRIARAAARAAHAASLRTRHAHALLAAAEASSQRGDFDAAERDVDDASRALDGTSCDLARLDVELCRARVLLRRGRALAARDAAVRVADRAAREGADAHAGAAHAVVALAALAEDDDEGAEAAARAARACIDDASAAAPDVRLVERVLRARRGSSRALRLLVEDPPRDAPLPAARVADLARASVHAGNGGPRGPADLRVDARGGRVVVGGTHEVDLSASPVLARLLRALLDAPDRRLSKEALALRVWRVRYVARKHDATLYKAVERLVRVLDPDGTGRVLGWDDAGHLALRAAFPILLESDPAARLSARQRTLLARLDAGLTLREAMAAAAVPRSTARRDLEELCMLGLAARARRGRATVYVRVPA